MLHDPTPHRVSACPVHFIWDGQGHGRAFVRAGFLLAIIGFALLSGASALAWPTLKGPSVVVLAVAAGVWSIGQLLSALAKRALPRPARR